MIKEGVQLKGIKFVHSKDLVNNVPWREGLCDGMCLCIEVLKGGFTLVSFWKDCLAGGTMLTHPIKPDEHDEKYLLSVLPVDKGTLEKPLLELIRLFAGMSGLGVEVNSDAQFSNKRIIVLRLRSISE